MKTTRWVAVAVLAACVGSAHALIYSGLVSTGDPLLKGQAGTEFLTIGGPATTAAAPPLIDFFPSNYFNKAPGSITRSFSYDVSTAAGPASNGLGLVFQGVVSGSGSASYIVTVNAIGGGNPVIASGTFNTTPGPGTSYSITGNLAFSTAVNNYRVTVQSTLSVAPTAPGFVGTSLFEFNHQPVPEPATLAAMGLGVAAFIRRRRK